MLTSVIYTQKSCLFEDEPARFVTEIQGDIILFNEYDEDIVAGKVKYFLSIQWQQIVDQTIY